MQLQDKTVMQRTFAMIRQNQKDLGLDGLGRESGRLTEKTDRGPKQPREIMRNFGPCDTGGIQS